MRGSTSINPISLTSEFGIGSGVSLLVWLSLKLHSLKVFKACDSIVSMALKPKNRKEAGKLIGEFFSDIENKNAEEVRKMKKLAMHYKIKLGEKRKLFCKYCYSVLRGKTRIKKGRKSVVCSACGRVSGWRIKTF